MKIKIKGVVVSGQPKHLLDETGPPGYIPDMDDRAFRKALQRAAREQGLDPTEVLAGWDVEKGLPQELGELLARVLREMADPNQGQNPDQNG